MVYSMKISSIRALGSYGFFNISLQKHPLWNLGSCGETPRVTDGELERQAPKQGTQDHDKENWDPHRHRVWLPANV